MSPDPALSFDTLKLHKYVDRFRSGDQQAADALLRRVGDRLQRLARRMLRGFPGVKRFADTDDILQNALLRLLRSLEATRPESTRDFFNLAAVQIRRELLDLARKFRGRAGPLPGDDVAAETTDGLDMDLDSWTAFHEAADKLPVEEREVISLKFYHGWTQPQIAEVLNVDERTVRRRWRSACAKLTEVLGGKLPRA